MTVYPFEHTKEHLNSSWTCTQLVWQLNKIWDLPRLESANGIDEIARVAE